MFQGLRRFNQHIGTWDVSSVQDMSEMLQGATAFDQDLSGWDTNGVARGGCANVTGGTRLQTDELQGWKRPPCEAALEG